MRKKLLVVILCCFANIGFAQCLSTDSLNLKWSKKKSYCQKQSKIPFSGCVSGWISCRETNLANIQELASIIHDWNFSSQDSTIKDYWYSNLYVIGELSKGKEVGIWRFYGEDKTLIGETNYNKKDYIEIKIYYPDKRVKYQKIIPCKSRRKIKKTI